MLTRMLAVRSSFLWSGVVAVLAACAIQQGAWAQVADEQVDEDIEWVSEEWPNVPADELENEIPLEDEFFELEFDDANGEDSEILEVDKALGAEKVQGKDDRKYVGNTTEFPWCAVGRIACQYGSRRIPRGTGVMIGTRTVLTCAHSLLIDGEWVKNVTFAPGQDGDEKPYGEIKVVKKRMKSKYFNEEDRDYDIAMMVLEKPIGKTTGYMWIASKSASYFGEPRGLNTAGYPQDLGGSYCVRQYRAYGKSCGLNGTGKLIHHYADSWPGQSGSPVWIYNKDAGERWVVGVHVAGGDSYNSAVRISDYYFNWINEYLKENDTISYKPKSSSSGSSSTGGTSKTPNPFLPRSLGGTGSGVSLGGTPPSACGTSVALTPTLMVLFAASVIRPTRHRGV